MRTGTVNFGVIGVKGIGRTHIDCIDLIEGAELVAVADIDESVGKTVASQRHVDWYADYERMLERDDLDAVCICTPHFLHAEMALRAMDHGKNVLVEKPMAITVGEADRMVTRARRRGVKLGVVYQYRTEPVYSEMKAIIERGDLGPIHRVLMEACELRTQAYYDSAPWRGSWGLSGGGALINQAIHCFDLLQWFVGRPVRLQGWIGTKLHRTEVEDVASAVMLFENGAQGAAQASVIDAPPTIRFEICGDKAKLIKENGPRLGLLETPIREFIERSNEVWGQPRYKWAEVTPKGRETGHVAVIRDFAEAISEDRDPLVPGTEARASLEIVNAVILSHFKGEPVTLPVDREEYARLMMKLSGGKKLRSNHPAEP
ncbi:TPA: Gfo/Idh/MocA family oxidoreductase [Candidatus Bathyarchaeota archaeon]|nr:Gfo/Idh/MocA family oxidoreductase [Candidatus Bathyarchaeota archaeon]